MKEINYKEFEPIEKLMLHINNMDSIQFIRNHINAIKTSENLKDMIFERPEEVNISHNALSLCKSTAFHKRYLSNYINLYVTPGKEKYFTYFDYEFIIEENGYLKLCEKDSCQPSVFIAECHNNYVDTAYIHSEYNQYWLPESTQVIEDLQYHISKIDNFLNSIIIKFKEDK